LSNEDGPPRREPDGRFSGGKALPPLKPKGRDEHGRYINDKDIPKSRPYSRALRELLDAPEGKNPDHWTQPLTEAQRLAMVHLSMARAGDPKIGPMVIERAEGKIPMPAEDKQGAVIGGQGVSRLLELLGIQVLDVKIEPELIEGQDIEESGDPVQAEGTGGSGSPQ
jgi:hypothetical protein